MTDRSRQDRIQSPTSSTSSTVHELIDRRWSPRRFADRPVPPEELRGLFEAARSAPSSFNEQPWAFLVATRDEPEAWQKVHSCLASGNQGWTESAPVLVLTFAKERFARNDRPNRHALHDVGQAVAVLTVEATHRGLAVHQMAGFDPDMVRETFAVPEGWQPTTAIAIGSPDEDRPERKRQPIEEMVFVGDWGEKPAWLTGAG